MADVCVCYFLYFSFVLSLSRSLCVCVGFSYQMSDCTFLRWSAVWMACCCVALVIRWRPLVLLNSKPANQHKRKHKHKHKHIHTVHAYREHQVGSNATTTIQQSYNTGQYFARYFLRSHLLRSAWNWTDGLNIYMCGPLRSYSVYSHSKYVHIRWYRRSSATILDFCMLAFFLLL